MNLTQNGVPEQDAEHGWEKKSEQIHLLKQNYLWGLWQSLPQTENIHRKTV